MTGQFSLSMCNKGYHNEISHLAEFENCEMKKRDGNDSVEENTQPRH